MYILGIRKGSKPEPNWDCPRTKYKFTTGRHRVSKDPAVFDIALRIVAGIDENYNLHPKFAEIIAEYGPDKACSLISAATQKLGSCDIIQNSNLFGGLTDDGSAFEFFEWSTPSSEAGQQHLRLTADEARAIVYKKKRTVVFTQVE